MLKETYIYFNRMEKIHYDLVMSISPELATAIKFSNRSVQQKEQLYNYKFQNIFLTALNLTTEKDEIYNRAINQIIEITELINQELETL